MSLEASIIAPSPAAVRRKKGNSCHPASEARQTMVRNAALTSLSDEILACRARAGAVECFEELVRRYQVPLLHFLLRKSPARNDAEDLLQESFLRAYQSLARYQEKWPFRTWLFTLSYRLSVSAARKTRPIAQDDNGYMKIVSDRAQDPADHAERGDTRDHLWRIARQTLNEEQYSALWLHYGQAMPAQEVAQVMGRSWVWVKTALHRSRRKLAIALETLGPPDSPIHDAIRGKV